MAQIVSMKSQEGQTRIKIARTNLEIAEKNVVIAKVLFNPLYKVFYSLVQELRYEQGRCCS
jgi:outer membrane protein